MRRADLFSMLLVNLFISLCLNLSPLQTQTPTVPSALSPASVEGVWLLRGTDRTVTFVFKRDRTFSYSGVGAASTGTWSLDGERIRLVWSTIDRLPVPAGKVRGSFPVTTTGLLTVNGYDYRRGDMSFRRP